MLCRKRREKGYSRGHVAQKLKLRREVIKQIEDDDCPHDAAFAGFVRSYASLLGAEVKTSRPQLGEHRRRLPQGLPISGSGGGFSVLAKVMALILLILAYVGWDGYTEGNGGELGGERSSWLAGDE